jgi:putative peptidoglycan lipid II flippase
MQLPLGIFGQAIGIAVLPTLAMQAAQADLPRFRATLAHGVRLSLFLTVPASALMMVLAQPLITMVFQRGHFTAAATANAVPALVFFSLGVASWSAQSVVARAFYARNDTWTPVLTGTGVTLLLFVPLNFLFRPLFNVPETPLLTRGPALAASIAATANVLILLWFAHRRFGGIRGREILGSLARTLVASLILAAGAWGTAVLATQALPPGHARAAAQLFGGGLAGTALFLLTTRLLGSEELRQIGTLVRRRQTVRTPD